MKNKVAALLVTFTCVCVQLFNHNYKKQYAEPIFKSHDLSERNNYRSNNVYHDSFNTALVNNNTNNLTVDLVASRLSLLWIMHATMVEFMFLLHLFGCDCSIK